MQKCIKHEIIETYFGFQISKEWDKEYDPIMDEYKGQAKVFYAVIDPTEDVMLESFKTLKEAKKWIEKIL